jgi:hypothetical protein
MTRATLLHVLSHPTAIGPAEVRELEQLAQTFPYCQTAHLLLAKAAHDQGTMLAGQRLRRAATYAANRELLRQLIDQVPAEAEILALTAVPAPAMREQPAVEVAIAASLPTVVEPAASVIATAPTPEPAVIPAVAPLPELVPAPAPAVADQEELALPVLPPEPIAEPVAEAAPVAAETLEVISPAPVSLAPAAELPLPTPPAAPEPAELPVVVPPIRPPVEVGAARFEFGLSPTMPPVPSPYELPDIVAELAAEAVAAAPTTPANTAYSAAAFTGDELLGYGLGESSRLGFALTPLQLPADPMPAAALPPVGEFFEPDALLTEHWAAHRPPAAPPPTSLDLINNFLRRQPRLSRPAAPPPVTEAQADLSMRSTRPEPELASESLARILARQGKTDRAIEIYQRLMVKQPEKMAYFEAQIQQLQPPV